MKSRELFLNTRTSPLRGPLGITQPHCLSFPILYSLKHVLTFSYHQESLLMALSHLSMSLCSLWSHLPPPQHISATNSTSHIKPLPLLSVPWRLMALAWCILYSSCFLIWFSLWVPDLAGAPWGERLRTTPLHLAWCSHRKRAQWVLDIGWRGWRECHVYRCNQEIWHVWAFMTHDNDLPWADQMRASERKKQSRWFWERCKEQKSRGLKRLSVAQPRCLVWFGVQKQ